MTCRQPGVKTAFVVVVVVLSTSDIVLAVSVSAKIGIVKAVLELGSLDAIVGEPRMARCRYLRALQCQECPPRRWLLPQARARWRKLGRVPPQELCLQSLVGCVPHLA